MKNIIESVFPFKNLFSGISLDDSFDKINRIYIFAIICIFGFITTVKQYTGDYVVCTHDLKHDKIALSQNFINNYCYSNNIYLEKRFLDIDNMSETDYSYIPYPGIGGSYCIHKPNTPICKQNNLKIYLNWYRWIPLHFYFNALLLLIPYTIYKNSNNMKNIKKIIININKENNMKNIINELNSVIEYIKFLDISILFMKFMYLLIYITIFNITKKIINTRSFYNYGIEYFKKKNIKFNILDIYFPLYGQCQIYIPGTSDFHNFFCILPLNVINQYLYLCLWFIIIYGITVNIFSILLFILQNYIFKYLNFIKKKNIYINKSIQFKLILNIIYKNIYSLKFNSIIKHLNKKIDLSNESNLLVEDNL